MILKELIDQLDKRDPDQIVKHGFHNPHSYRGYYDELAFEAKSNTTIGEMLACAQKANGNTYTGWKGGKFTMNDYTTVYLAEIGCCGEELGFLLVSFMLGNCSDPPKRKKILSKDI